ncbi:MAG TPA: hypothetical protein VI685_01140 [Candidatus Angelobacter sp.]
MAKESKSPQRKKELEYTLDHVTFGWDSSRRFPKTWRRKKTHINRETRRKSQEILAAVKPGMEAGELDLVADDLTAVRFQKSVSRKRLHKTGTVTVGEKVKRKLERRREAVGRRVQSHKKYDDLAASAVNTLASLQGEELVDAVRRADLLCRGRNAAEVKRVHQASPLDRALSFLYTLSSGSALVVDALRRNRELAKTLIDWDEKAGRILERDRRARERKTLEKQEARKRSSSKLSKIRDSRIG